MNKQQLLGLISQAQGEVMATANEIGMRDHQPEWKQFWVAERAIRYAYYLVHGGSKEGTEEAFEDLQRAIQVMERIDEKT